MIKLSEEKIKNITEYIFYKNRKYTNKEEYDLIFMSGDGVEKQIINKLIELKKSNLITNKTKFIISKSHTVIDPEFNEVVDSLVNLQKELKKYSFDNEIIVPKNIISTKVYEELKDLFSNCKNILIMVKDFTRRRQFLTIKKMGFDTNCFEWYGLVDNRNISEDDWYKTEEGINQVLKEFLNIKDIEIVKKLREEALNN